MGEAPHAAALYFHLVGLPGSCAPHMKSNLIIQGVAMRSLPIFERGI
jgi:hypothetical protein